MAKKGKVLILMPVYNVGKYLGKAIESVANQTYKNIELIAINDGSTDNSESILQEWRNRLPNFLHYKTIENDGTPTNIKAWQEALQLVKKRDCDYITLMGSDDYILPNKVKFEVEFLERHPEVDIVYTDYVFTDADLNVVISGANLSLLERRRSSQFNPDELLFRCIIPDFAMVRRKCWEYIDFNIEPFFKYKQRFLWHIWLIFSERFNIVHRPTITYLYRQHSKQQLQHLARKEKDDKQIIRDIQFEALERRRRPRMLDIGLTDKCNLRCIMCPRNDPKIKLSEMDYNDFRKIVDEVPCEEIQLAGALGESLLYKDLFRCIEYCKEKNIRVYLTTNATLLTPDISRRLLDLDIHYISFSVDGATKETYERIRKGAIFEEVVNNIKNFTSLKKKMGKNVIVELVPVIIVGYNDHEISQLIDLGAYLEVDRVCIGDIQYKFDIGVSTKEHSLRLQKNKLIIGEIQKAVKRAVVLGIKVATPRLDISKTWTKCRYPWFMLTVTSSGGIRPCCGTHRKNIGNILREGFDRIWNSKSFYEWRKQVMSENPPLECIHCPMF